MTLTSERPYCRSNVKTLYKIPGVGGEGHRPRASHPSLSLPDAKYGVLMEGPASQMRENILSGAGRHC